MSDFCTPVWWWWWTTTATVSLPQKLTLKRQASKPITTTASSLLFTHSPTVWLNAWLFKGSRLQGWPVCPSSLARASMLVCSEVSPLVKRTPRPCNKGTHFIGWSKVTQVLGAHTHNECVVFFKGKQLIASTTGYFCKNLFFQFNLIMLASRPLALVW